MTRRVPTNSLFRLRGVPLFYLPYVTHPVDASGRQSGFLIPVLGESSTKGLIIGEEFYLVINRSTDMKVGLQYYSRRGWAQSAEVHYRGFGNDFFTATYNGLLDRGLPQVGRAADQPGRRGCDAGHAPRLRRQHARRCGCGVSLELCLPRSVSRRTSTRPSPRM